MSETRRYFGLTGPSKMFDRRTHAIRGDLADIAMAGKMFAPHYAVPVERMCIVPHALTFFAPGGENASELLYGERFWLLDISGQWAWGYTGHDHYVGYIKADAIGMPSAVSPPPLNADPVDTAKSFLDVPYVWGGRGGAGIDCSGMVQRALASAGIAAPRDSDLQQAVLGEILPETESLKRGDLIFLPGHVGMMVNQHDLIHATQFHMKTVIEPLDIVTARYTEQHGTGITARKRIPL